MNTETILWMALVGGLVTVLCVVLRQNHELRRRLKYLDPQPVVHHTPVHVSYTPESLALAFEDMAEAVRTGEWEHDRGGLIFESFDNDKKLGFNSTLVLRRKNRG